MSHLWSNVTILVVEDDPSMRDMLFMVLEAEGAKVFSAENGEVAKKVIQENNIDIVVSDVQMPVCDGVDLLKWVKENFEGIPLVFLATGFADISESAALSLGAEAIFKKPFEAETIIEHLSSFFEKIIEKRN